MLLQQSRCHTRTPTCRSALSGIGLRRRILVTASCNNRELSAPDALVERQLPSPRPVADAPSALQRLGSLFLLADASASVASLANPAVAAAASAADAPTVQRAGGWVAPLADALEQVLYFLQEGLDKLHVPYSYGYSIILLTLIVKIATFPLTKQQVESTMAIQSLKPRIDLIKDRYGDDKDKIQKETSLLYEQAGVNPLAGCLPSLATIPVFIGLFSSLTNVANRGLLDTQGFYWIPSLAGPTTMAQRQSGLGTSWLLPLVDGTPPIGWDTAAAYLVLPVLLVLGQYASSALTTPPMDPRDENANTQRALMVGLPLMIGWFALNVPSGLSLYYLSNTVLTAAQQIYLKKLGGANVVMNELGPVTKPGSGRRLGTPVSDFTVWVPTTVMTTAETAKAKAEAEAAAEAAREAAEAAAYDNSAASGMSYNGSIDGNSAAAAAPAAAAVLAAAAVPESVLDPSKVSRRCKRRRLTSLVQDGSSGVGSSAVPAAASSGSA